jgi:hypothetical protein
VNQNPGDGAPTDTDTRVRQATALCNHGGIGEDAQTSKPNGTPAGESLQYEGFEPTLPHPARIYDYWVGGKDNFTADRRVGAEVAELAPWVISGARGNRAFLGRAVSWLAEAGVDQFLDVGAGLPGAGNVHEVAQAVNPLARTVYVDNDDVVLVHARALLARDDRTIAVSGDARAPWTILDDPAVRAHLDLNRPVALLLVAVLHFIVSQEQAAGIVAAFRDRLAPGSYLVVSHVADLSDTIEHPERVAATQAAARLYESLAAPFTLRRPDEVVALFDGFDPVPPGIVPAHLWHPHRGRPGPAIPVLAGIGHLSDIPGAVAVAKDGVSGKTPVPAEPGDRG